jgi:hypothetical protein
LNFLFPFGWQGVSTPSKSTLKFYRTFGYFPIAFSRSLFQSKDEPEGHEGQAKWGRSFRVLNLSQVSSRSLCGGMWESVVSISKVGGKAVGSFIPADFSTDRHFFRPFRQPMR